MLGSKCLKVLLTCNICKKFKGKTYHIQTYTNMINVEISQVFIKLLS